MKYLFMLLFLVLVSCTIDDIKKEEDQSLVQIPCSDWSECVNNYRTRTCGGIIETEYCGID